MGSVMDGEATPSQLAALLMGLRMRGETVDELAGFASAMRERVVRVEAPEGAIDVVGTGGDGSGRSTSRRPRRSSSRRPGSRSPSTATARSPRGRGRRTCSTRWASGSTTTPPPRARRSATTGSRSCSRRRSTRRCATPARPARELGVRTAFNLLGPLTNPAGARRAASSASADADAGAADRGRRRAAGHRAHVRHPRRRRRRAAARRQRRPVPRGPEGVVAPRDQASALGLQTASTTSSRAGPPQENARLVEGVLRGEPGRPARRRAAQRRGRAPRRGRGRPARGGDREGGVRRRRRARRRAARRRSARSAAAADAARAAAGSAA